MTQLTYQIPILGNPSVSEDPKTHDALSQIQTVVNGGIDSSNLANGAATPLKLGTAPYASALASVQNLPNNAFTTMVFSTEEWDTDNIIDLGTHNDRFTIVTPGVYVVEARVRHVFNADSARRISTLTHTRSGSTVRGTSDARVNVGLSGSGGDTGTSMILITGCLAGDIFQIQGFQDSGGTTTMDGRMSLTRTGSL